MTNQGELQARTALLVLMLLCAEMLNMEDLDA